MENESRVGRVFTSINEKLQEQVWFQQLKSKWDELDQRTRTAVKFGLVGGTAVILLVVVLSSLFSVSEKRKELDEKLAMVHKIQLAQDELRKLKAITSGPGLTGSGDWTSYIQAQAGEIGLSGEAIKVTEKPATAGKLKSSNTAADETLIDIQVTKVNVKQLTKLVFQIENGPRTAKVRNLQVDTQPDESGYLDVKVSVSGFTLAKTN